ncbi:MAG: HAD family hydrolase [Chitinophagaceae bacterium]
MSKALIFDLDNTIYPVHSIGAALFAPLFSMLEDSGELQEQMDAVKDAIQRKPFQVVAAEFGFNDALTQGGIQLLKNLSYNGPIEPFPDFQLVLTLPQTKFLVTTGFTKLQESKIDGMRIRELFQETHIVDPMQDARTKKDVFSDILTRYAFQPHEVMVIGDDPDSEIKAAHALGIPTILFDALGRYSEWNLSKRIESYGALPLAISY